MRLPLPSFCHLPRGPTNILHRRVERFLQDPFQAITFTSVYDFESQNFQNLVKRFSFDLHRDREQVHVQANGQADGAASSSEASLGRLVLKSLFS